jgi:CcmD family protein
VFDKFDERARTEMPATPFVAGAYAFIWVALGIYVFIIARGLRRAETEVAELKRRVEARGAASGPGPSAPAGTTR